MSVCVLSVAWRGGAGAWGELRSLVKKIKKIKKIKPLAGGDTLGFPATCLCCCQGQGLRHSQSRGVLLCLRTLVLGGVGSFLGGRGVFISVVVIRKVD